MLKDVDTLVYVDSVENVDTMKAKLTMVIS